MKTSRRAVVHRDGDRDLDCLLALLEDVDEVLVDAEDLGNVPQLLACDLERVLAKMRDGSLRSRHGALFLEGLARGEYTGLFDRERHLVARPLDRARLGVAVTRMR